MISILLITRIPVPMHRDIKFKTGVCMCLFKVGGSRHFQTTDISSQITFQMVQRGALRCLWLGVFFWFVITDLTTSIATLQNLKHDRLPARSTIMSLPHILHLGRCVCALLEPQQP